jgi:ribulose-5-phosphate 4-epimerase/fuculose-1-phosphate aldolase
LRNEIRTLLLKDKARFSAKGLFGNPDDSLSMRIPGRQEFLLTLAHTEAVSTEAFETDKSHVAELHAAIYRSRADAGAVLIGQTPWSAALAALGMAIPTLFDELARHIGKVELPVCSADKPGLLGALKGGSNIAICGDQRVCLGTTSDRLVFNAELFEKCAKAFVIAQTSGQRIRKVPGWVCYIAGGRLRKDQKRAAESYAAGRIPEGTSAY